MGSGRSELARILFGLDDHDARRILVDGKPYAKPSARRSIDAGMAFVTENRREEGLLMDISIAENIGLVGPAALCGGARSPALRKVATSARLRAVAESLKIKSGDIRQQAVKTLERRQPAEVCDRQVAARQAAVLIIDEPTRGVDVGAKYEIYSIINDLAAQGTGVLFISSELEELIGVCDRILVMSNGEIQATFARAEFDKERILRAAFRENGS
jgi:ribose transport system ATP-binding protein